MSSLLDIVESLPLILVSQGIAVKKGKFTTSEEVAVRDALDSFREVSVPYPSVLRLECVDRRQMASRMSRL